MPVPAADHCLAVSPDGTWLASAGGDQAIRGWEPSSGRAVASSRVDGALDKLCWIGDNLIAVGPRGVYHYQLASGPSHSSAGCWLEPA
jgi:WD40 repeat protein